METGSYFTPEQSPQADISTPTPSIMRGAQQDFARERNHEVIHNGPKNGQLVQITGNTVKGTGINGVPATYVWVYSPDFGVSGYVNAYFIG